MTARDMNARRSQYEDHYDDFPTPPWATRALFEYVLGADALRRSGVLEPAAGRGHMARALDEYTRNVTRSDLHRGYGCGVEDFTTKHQSDIECYDWVVTNPPYKFADKFIERGLFATEGLALLLRVQWLTGVDRFYRMHHREGGSVPAIVAPFARRVPMEKSRVIRDGSPFFQHIWVVWRGYTRPGQTRMVWIPPSAQRELEREEDYHE